MSDDFFTDVPGKIRFGGLDSDDPLTFKVYEPDRLVLGKRMEDHLRIGVCLWHSFSWPGSRRVRLGHVRPAVARRPARPDGRGPRPSSTSPSSSSTSSACRSSASTTATSRPRARPSPRPQANLDAVVDDDRRRTWSGPALQLLWGTANLFSHPRYAAGAATNPDPEVFAYAAAQVKHDARGRPSGSAARTTSCGAAARATTRCSTPTSRREEDQLARFLHLVVEHKHKIGFNGHAPDRAEAEGADQAPVRLRRRDRPRLPARATASTASTSSTSRPTTRRWPATASSTRSPTRSPTACSAASTPTAATTRTAGTPTSSRTRSTTCRWPSTRSCGPAA